MRRTKEDEPPSPPPMSPRSRSIAPAVSVLPRRIRTLNKREWQEINTSTSDASDAMNAITAALGTATTTKKTEQLFWPTDKEFFVQRSTFWTLVHSIREDDFLTSEDAPREDAREFTAEVTLQCAVGKDDDDNDDDDEEEEDDYSDDGSNSSARENVMKFQLLRVAKNILFVAPCKSQGSAKNGNGTSGSSGSAGGHRFRPLFELTDLVSTFSRLSFVLEQPPKVKVKEKEPPKWPILGGGSSPPPPPPPRAESSRTVDNVDILINPYFFGGFSYYRRGQLITGTVGTDNYSELVKQEELVHHDIQLVSSAGSSRSTTVGLDEEHAKTFLRLMAQEWERNIEHVQARYEYEQVQQQQLQKGGTTSAFAPPTADVEDLPWGKRTFASMVLLSTMLSSTLDIKSLTYKLQQRRWQFEAEEAALRATGSTVVAADAAVEVVEPSWDEQPATSQRPEGQSEGAEVRASGAFAAPPPPPPPPPPELPDGLLQLPDKTQVGDFAKSRRIPGSGRSMVDKRANTPGRAFLDDSDRTDIASHRLTGQQKEARELLVETVEKFTQLKSFFTVVAKEQVGDRLRLWSPDPKKDDTNVQNRTIEEEEEEKQKEDAGDTSESGDTTDGFRNETDFEDGDDNNDNNEATATEVDDQDEASAANEADDNTTHEMVQTTFVLRVDSSITNTSSTVLPKNSKLFYMIRIQPSVILAAPSKIDPTLIAYCQKVLRPSLLPEDGKYDLLFNPYFFCGSFNDRFANVDRSLVSTDGEEDGIVACLCERFARCFLLCFHNLWKATSLNAPSVDYNAIADGYSTYAASLVLRVYGPYTVREVSACEGVVGMYSVARTAGFGSAEERSNYLRLAQVREMFYFARCTQIGIRLNRAVPLDIVERECSVPWSTHELLDIPSRRDDVAEVEVENKNVVNDTTMAVFSVQTMADSTKSYTMTPQQVARLGDRMSEGTALFFAAVARELELDGTAMVTPINHVSLLFNYDAEESPTLPQDQVKEASELLLRLSDQTRKLPGAALVPAKGWGVRNLQLGEPAYEGHVLWIKSYSEKDSIIATVAIVLATALAAWLETAVFHFVIALIAVEYVGEEVSIQGPINVLWQGRGNVRRGIQLCGHLLRSENFALVLLTVSLGLVEAASDMVEFELPFNYEIPIAVFYAFLMGGCVVSCGILLVTRHLWSYFEPITQEEANTYEGVVRRDGSVGCLLTGEKGTGFRAADDINNVGVAPLQAQELDRSIYRGRGLHTTTSPPLQRVEKWVLCG